MPFAHLINLERGGSITLIYNALTNTPEVSDMSPGPAFDALAEAAEADLGDSNSAFTKLTPKLIGQLYTLRDRHGGTITRELSAEIDNQVSLFQAQVRVEPERISEGTTIKLFFDEEEEAFYKDVVTSVERTQITPA